MHRQSPPHKTATPPNQSPSELRRLDEARPSSAYHPSEAAHHPPSLPSMQTITQPPPQEMRKSAPPQEEHHPPPPPTPQQQQPPPPPPATVVYEPAARKMDVDENYDDSGDEKRSITKQESDHKAPIATATNWGPGSRSRVSRNQPSSSVTVRAVLPLLRTPHPTRRSVSSTSLVTPSLPNTIDRRCGNNYSKSCAYPLAR